MTAAKPEQPGTRVLAVITAYNPHSSLFRCLAALSLQTRLPDGILVIDNSEPEGADLADTSKVIAARTRQLRPGVNLGPAGGFALGLAIFLSETEWTHAWPMDDDVFPEPNCLENLVKASEQVRPGSLVLPTDFVEQTGEQLNAPGWIGGLLDRTAVQLGGLPVSEYFWWGEDTEYLHFRLPRKGVTVRRIPEAKVILNFARRPAMQPAWKYYYKVRNTTHYRLHVVHIGPRGAFRLAEFWVKNLRWASQAPNRREAVPLVLKAIADGLLGRLGIRVRPPIPEDVLRKPA